LLIICQFERFTNLVQINAWLQFVEVGASIDDARQMLLRASISRMSK